MKIESLTAYGIKIPFRITFRHSRAERSFTENIIVKVVLDDGAVGWGECIPRRYVTGETPESVMSGYRGLEGSEIFREFLSFEDGINFLSRAPVVSYGAGGGIGSAGWCALELAFLDALCRSKKKTFRDVAAFFLPEELIYEKSVPVRYSAVVSEGPVFSAMTSAAKYRLFGFRDVKVKVGRDIETDYARLKWIRRISGGRTGLRIDANGCYTIEEAVRAIKRFEDFGISAVEEPLAVDKKSDLKSLKDSVDVPLMLDESVCTIEDARQAARMNWCDIFNIRISKVGGFIKACQMAHLAAKSDKSFQLGCMVGESGILSAAGRHFASNVRGTLNSEGSYDRYLLGDNIIAGDITFGRGGVAEPLTGFGLCVDVDESKVESLLVEKEVIR